MEIKTEADSSDITEWSHDDVPSTGMFAVSDTVCYVHFSCVFCYSVRMGIFATICPVRAPGL